MQLQPARRARSPRSVSSQYRKKSSSNRAHRVEHLAAVHGRAAAGQQNLFFGGEALGRLEMAALLAAAVRAHQHAGRIQAPLARQHNRGRPHAGLRIGFGRAQQRAEPARIGYRVVVDGRQQRSARFTERRVDGRAETHIAFLLHDAYAETGGIGGADQALAAVIHDDDLKTAFGLAGQRRKTFQEGRSRLQGRDRYCDTRFGQLKDFTRFRASARHRRSAPGR